ncbi:MAG: Spore cortex-lytic enzyme precursor [Firmicutes bacterium ADurb.Bin456]|nr:MAG: Spore cortex-lytic enzyme precursor [Firmicutes bacterium ADurb.Bin456]
MKRKRLIIACSVVLLCSLATIPASRAYSGQPGQQNQKQGRILFLQDPHFTGNDVMDLQQRLRVLGYYKGNLNGVYDQVTARAVALAQESLDLHPDGTVNLYGPKAPWR